MIPGNDDEPIRLFHTSLGDFLTSKAQSGDFFIDPPARHLWILVDCLKLMAIPSDTDIFFRGTASGYACINWCHHFNQWLTIRIEGDNLFDTSHDDALTSYLTNFVSQSSDRWVNTLLYKSMLQGMLNVLHLIRVKLEVSFFFLGFRMV
jgi:hypothetical protein